MKGKKSIGVFGALLAISLPAWAGTALPAWTGVGPEFYGRLDADLESVSNAGSGLTRLMSNASRFGLRGNKELGNKLKVIYQAEVGFDLNGSANNGFGSSRNSQLGLMGDFGTVFAGNWDTPYFTAHDPVELFGNTTIATSVNLTGRVANAASTTTPIANFNNHQANVIQYWLPALGGFQVKLAYAPDNSKTTTSNKTVYSMSATYDNEAFYGACGFESHRDGSFSGQADKASRLVGGIKLKNALVSATLEHISVGTSATTSASRTGYELAGKYGFGANHIGLAYSMAGDLGGVVNSGAKQYSLRYGRDLDSDTEFYAFYTALANKANGTYNFKDGAVAGVTAGARLSGFGVGIAYNF